jgi:hypothetical protein
LVKTSTNKNLGVERPPLRGNIRLFSFGKKFFILWLSVQALLRGQQSTFFLLRISFGCMVTVQRHYMSNEGNFAVLQVGAVGQSVWIHH